MVVCAGVQVGHQMSNIALRLLRQCTLRPVHHQRPLGFFDSFRNAAPTVCCSSPHFQPSFTSLAFRTLVSTNTAVNHGRLSDRLPNILQIVRTRVLNATHRNGPRLNGGGWGNRPPPRQDWWDSLDSNIIFYGIIAINAGVYLAWQSAISTYVRLYVRHLLTLRDLAGSHSE